MTFTDSAAPSGNSDRVFVQSRAGPGLQMSDLDIRCHVMNRQGALAGCDPSDAWIQNMLCWHSKNAFSMFTRKCICYILIKSWVFCFFNEDLSWGKIISNSYVFYDILLDTFMCLSIHEKYFCIPHLAIKIMSSWFFIFTWQSRTQRGKAACHGTDVVWATVTKYHRFNGIQVTDIYFLGFWELKIQSQSAWMTVLLNYRLLTCHWALTRHRGWESFLGSVFFVVFCFLKDINPIHERSISPGSWNSKGLWLVNAWIRMSI